MSTKYKLTRYLSCGLLAVIINMLISFFTHQPIRDFLSLSISFIVAILFLSLFDWVSSKC